MSTATFAPAQASAVKSRTLLVSRSLAWIEGLRLIRHPLVVASALLGSVLFVLFTRHEAPVLNRHDSLITEALLPAAGGILVAAHLATLRARRHRTVELHRSTPSSATAETAGHLMGVAIASVAALGLALLYLAYLEIAGGVTSPRPLVVLTGPAVVLLGGALGVAGARWLPYTAAGPLLLIGVVGISFVLMGDCSTNTGDCRIRYLSPLVLSEAWTATPSELAYRPAGAHLTYLGGLALAASAGALLRFRRDLVTALVGIVALGVAVMGAYFQAQPPPGEARRSARLFVTASDAVRSCNARDSVRYCAYPGYAAWIEPWRAAVGGVVAAVPPERRIQLNVTQLPRMVFGWEADPLVRPGKVRRARRRSLSATPQGIHPGLQWARGAPAGEYQLVLALEAAQHLTGMDTRFPLSRADRRAMSELVGKPKRLGRLGSKMWHCYALERGRAIVALWLAAQATPETEDAFRRALIGNTSSSLELYGLADRSYEVTGEDYHVLWGSRDAHYAAQLLRRDEAEVRRLLAIQWDRLVDPSTGADGAAALLGLERLPSLENVLDRSPARLVYAPLCR